MPIRLLSKSEIAKQKSNARRMDIEEGVKVAKRIDNLRQVAAEEETSLTNFRNESVAKIHADLKKENEVLAKIKQEVRALKDERAELLKPLDKEWEAIIKEKSHLEQKSNDLIQKEIILKGTQSEVDRAIKQASDSLTKAINREEKAHELLKEAKEDRDDAFILNQTAQEIKENAVAFDESLRNELRERDITVAAKERDLSNKEIALDEKERLLSDRERFINDKYATLLRTQKYNGRR